MTWEPLIWRSIQWLGSARSSGITPCKRFLIGGVIPVQDAFADKVFECQRQKLWRQFRAFLPCLLFRECRNRRKASERDERVFLSASPSLPSNSQFVPCVSYLAIALTYSIGAPVASRQGTREQAGHLSRAGRAPVARRRGTREQARFRRHNRLRTNHFDGPVDVFGNRRFEGYHFARLRMTQGQPAGVQCLACQYFWASFDGAFALHP